MNEISGHERKWPLEQPDGANAFLDSLADLGNSPLTWHLDERFTGAEISALVDDLEDAYYQAAAPWQPPRPVFGSTNNQDESKWLDESFLETLQREATLRFWELVTTTRFSVYDPPNIHALDFVNPVIPPITLIQVASLAAMACIFDAINELESILNDWQQIADPYLEGRSFDCLVGSDAEFLESVLQETTLDEPDVLAQCQAQTQEAREACNQANAWLLLADSLQYQAGENDRKARNKSIRDKAEKSEQARKRAILPRPKARNPVSSEQVGAFFNDRKGQRPFEIAIDAALEFGTSVSTIWRRYKEFENSTFTNGASDVT